MKSNRLLLTVILALSSLSVAQATDYIRYVSKSKGAYNNDGTSWISAKVNVQDAINDMASKLEEGDRGYVFVEAGTYKPTQSVAGSGSSTLYMSIQIPAGISVYGGFAGSETGTTPQSIIAQRETVETEVGTYMKYKTVFTGSLSSAAVFEWNGAKHRYATSFYGNCYHVVWFGTNGYTTDTDGSTHYTALADSAVLDGVIIRDGYAYNSDIKKGVHNAFGGGAYLVDNAIVRNCEVYHCEASRGGAGLYLDRGGRVENCYVHDCQTLGINSTTGFGGGIGVDQKGVVTHCALINNVGRSGGGLSLSYDATADTEGYGLYAAAASCCLIAQNVSTVEGGGVYLNQGGLINGMTIVKNKTYGTGVTLNGIVTGRSGGVYIRNHARVYNSVLWGNETNANNTNNIQYATSRSSSDNALKPLLTYVALSKADYTDWSGTKKIGISKLAEENSGEASGLIKYALFTKVCAAAGHVDDLANTSMEASDSYVKVYRWLPSTSSGLCYAGLQLLDIVETDGYDLSAAYLTDDLKNEPFSPKCALGAYTSDAETPSTTTINSLTTMFVDPERASGSNYINPGNSWDNPMDNLTDALNYFAENNLSGQIFVKEGTICPASRTAHGRLRGTTIPMVSNVSVYGGYSTKLTGTDTSDRNPVEYPTIVSGKVTENNYASSIAHLVTFDGVTNSVLDGFELRWGNASSTVIADYGQNGGGVLVTNGASAILRNTTVADCMAAYGSAVCAESGTVTAENCIFRNNASSRTSSSQSGGTLYIKAGATMVQNHCDIVRNVGHAVVNEGTFSSVNSIFYANMQTEVEDTNDKEGLALTAFQGAGTYSGSYNLFDVASSTDANAVAMGQAVLTYTFSTTSTTYPRFVNSTKNAGISESGDVTYYGRAVDYTPSDMNPAVNAATTGNVSHVSALSDGSWGYDMTTVAPRDYGGLPDIGALENGAFTANSATQPSYGTVIYVRDYNTYSYNADGSIASTLSTDYNTTHEDGTPRDGSSWNNAINGNAKYGVSTYLLTYPKTCTIDNPVYQYKIGMSNSENSLTCYFPKYNGQYFYSDTSIDDADACILIPVPNSADSMVYIYNMSKGKYYTYVDANQGQQKVVFSDTNTSHATWKLVRKAVDSNLRTYGIVPGELAGQLSSPGWNYWYGPGDPTHYIGLYPATDGNGGWQFHAIGNNGLQKAVNTASETMLAYSSTRTVTSSENAANGGDATTTTRTYHDFTASDECPEISVWVGAGLYTSHVGYAIRDLVKVYGGFPRVGNPGMNERHPQLTSGVALSAANTGLQVQDYETILQTNTSIAERNAKKEAGSVLWHPQEGRVTVNDGYNTHRDRVVYQQSTWDGFTMRYGWKAGVTGSNGGRRQGGPGVTLFEGVTLSNCVVRDNMLDTDPWNAETQGRGGGIYCDGSTVINCYVMDNQAKCGAENFGGGIYMIKGTMYNTVVTGNKFTGGPNDLYGKNHGNGVFFESANFYNNTIVNNSGGTSAIGVWSASAEEAHLTVYNSIVMGNDNVPVLRLENGATPASFDHCFLQTTYNGLLYGNYSAVTISESSTHTSVAAADRNPFAIDYDDAVANYDYRIEYKDDYNCVNAGTESLGNDPYTDEVVTLPDNDIDWSDRVKDCRVDIGAYEYNGAAAITPDTQTEEGWAIYYVTENGFGTTQAFNQANAACAVKLQKVLDAAGRYKYDHPDVRVVVKLAGVDATLDAYSESSCFKYYPCRTTEDGNDNVRVWSIMVPRGVEVWGGYTDDYTVTDEATGTVNVDRFTDDERSVMYHPTFLQTQYDNSDLNETVRGYHVVTFTDKTFDIDGNERSGMTLSGAGVTDRAVLDGLFLVGGQADGESFGSAAAQVNLNQYGGAAVVTDFAHVRNCILKNNSATYGGALALMNNGLVSGCLIIDNEAEYGGGVYVIEDGVTLSNGDVNSTSKGSATAIDANMPHVYTTTIVKNTGNQQGGGLWFSNDADEPNVRVNSTVLWQNDSPDQANVAGQTSPDMPTDDNTISTIEWYPFAYSAVQNLRLSGTSNISVDIQNRRGNRFGIDSMTDSTTYDGKTIATDTTQVDYYGLTVFSALCRTGMPYSSYAQLVASQGLAEMDYNKWRRDTVPVGTKSRTYVDIGARAYPSSSVTDLDHPFIRLYVAQTQDVNMDAYQAMQDYSASADSADADYVYGLLGSSFAYPFQNLDDALSYIAELRMSDKWKDRANNLPFEICIARGEYFPQRDMQGNYGYSLANTFLIPEGVTLMGGFDCNNLYGQYLKPSSSSADSYTNVLSDNVVRFDSDTSNVVGVEDERVELIQLPLDSMAQRRILEDLNFNNILEPWEFQNQTNLSGNAVNLQNSGVYHVVSVIPYAPGVGQLPTPTYTNPDYDEQSTQNGVGSVSKYVGQPVIIDGVHISDGYAHDYVEGSLNDIGIYDYYRGAGLHGTGNWYSEQLDGSDDDLMHRSATNAVAYRDIPLYIRNSQFINNQAGYGAAIDVNLSTHIYNCLFAQNEALSQTESIKWTVPAKTSDYGETKTTTVSYPGNGAAVFFTNGLEVYNTIFSNNEAYDAKAVQSKTLTYATYPTLQNPSSTTYLYGGVGAALCGGDYSRLKVLNCDFVNNRACLYPAIFTMNPNHGLTYASSADESEYNLVANSVFWGNEVTPGVSSDNTFAQGLCINYSKEAAGSTTYNIQLSNAPQSQDDLDANYSEALWFSGYEDGRAATPVNSKDYRLLSYSSDEYIARTIYQHWASNYAETGSTYTVQNANITLSSDNDDVEGPNFCNPSSVAGVNGYNEAADWSRARINNLTDNGSCFLNQNVIDAGADGYLVEWKTDTDDTYSGDGAYYETYYQTEQNKVSLDLGKDIYMRSVATGANLSRVAADPCPTHSVAYIDLGVYEYPHCKLVPSVEGDAVDILWVSTIERPENGEADGKLWETPTSDLQRAIETLLASRNGHRKEIRIMDGEYAPLNQFGDFRTFYINTLELNNAAYFPTEAYDGSTLLSSTEDVAKLFVRSLTFKGGYSKDLRDQYDTELYPSLLRMVDRLDGVSNTWDHLVLIDDATQRYGKGEASGSGYGSKIYDTAPTSIPIQFDGIKFVNNQALSGTHGAAIRYNDQVNTYEHEGIPYTDYVDAPSSANISISKAEYDELKDVSGSGVNCTYWTDDTYTTPSTTGETDYVLYYRTIEHPSKLTLSKCCVMNSGTHYDASTLTDHTSSAVYIGQYGGDALIYNSVFHSNWGNPLEAYNTRTINNTVALNHGRWILTNSGNIADLYETGTDTGTGEMLAPRPRTLSQDAAATGVVTQGTYTPRHSKIMNTVMWRNNPTTTSGTTTYGKQFALDGYVSDSDASSDSIFRRNSYTLYKDGEIVVTEGTDYDDASFVSNYWNTYLALDNENISYGPNFTDPNLSASDYLPQGDIEQRDFSLRPSVRLVDKGDSTIYAEEVYDMAWIPTTELDYLDQDRVISLNIEVGAIEYPQPLLRVIYVDPTQNENKTGLGWGSTMNADNLQNAIDMAAIYSATNPIQVNPATGEIIDRNEAYVFVKGDNNTLFPEVTMRSGVNVFGSIDPNNVTDSVRYTIDEQTGQYRYPYLQEDVANVVHNRPGLVGTHTEQTIVPYITTGQNNAFDTDRPTRIDGVKVSAVSTTNTTGAVIQPVVNVDPTSSVQGEIPAVALTNILVADNDATGSSTDMAIVNNALIYEVLFRDNKVDADNYVLNIGQTGYGVNLTVEGRTSDAQNQCIYPTTDDQYELQDSHIWYSIYNYSGKPADENTLSAYNYELEEPNLNYQLTEHSQNIDRCPDSNPMLLSASTANLVEFINYDTDVDLLANPRVLDVRAPEADRKLDRGAFETWCIGDDQNGQTVTTNVDASIYFGNYYPHEGSVVYLLENSNLISEAHSLVPGYLLVKRGASLFGHGQTVKAAYVAVERDIAAEGTIVAVPYAMDYNYWQTTSHGPATYSYDGNGVLTLVPDANTSAYTYNGSSRAAARYQILNSNSGCWDRVARDADAVAACQGVFFSASQSTVYRFTGQGTSMKNYIYTEQPEVDAEGNLVTTAKKVALTQNNAEPTDGNGNLTASEDMGWNCFGIPFLVSEYKPYEMAYDAVYNTTAGSLEYMMHLPKQLWLYYDGLQTLTDFGQVNSWTSADARNYAGFYAAPSWSSAAADWHLSTTPSLWVGEGMFAQTASFADEDLYFYLPIYSGNDAGAAPARRLMRLYIQDEVIEETVDREDALRGTVYDLQGRRIQSPSERGVYVVDGKKVCL